jgi:hypothetical protein
MSFRAPVSMGFDCAKHVDALSSKKAGRIRRTVVTSALNDRSATPTPPLRRQHNYHNAHRQ